MSLWASLRTWPRRLLGRGDHTPLDVGSSKHLVYEGKPVWWSRHSWALVAVDLLVVSSMAEVTWNHWTEPAPASNSNQNIKQQYVLRPAWQRLALAGGQFASGLLLALALVRMQGRSVRRLYIVPRKPSSPSLDTRKAQVLIQTRGHGAAECWRASLAECALTRGRDASEVILRVRGRGALLVEMRGARVRGREVGMAQAGEELREAFTGRKGAGMGGWRSGPVVQ